MLNQEIPKEKLEKLKLLVLDSDGVCIPRGTKIWEKEIGNSYEVNFKTDVITDEFADSVNQLKKKIKICISSGRSMIYLQSIYGKILGEGTTLIAENGNLFWVNGHQFQYRIYPEEYFVKLAKIKNEIKQLPISGFEPKQFILTVHSPMELKEVYEIVKKYDIDNYLKVMWNGEAFDVMSKDVSKGESLKFLLKYLNISQDETIAIGDRVNDKELLEVAGIGVSADQEKLPAEFWTIGQGLPGELLVKHLLEVVAGDRKG